MLIAIPNLLTPQQVEYARQKLDAANWTDGAATAGFLAKKVKRNRQIDHSDPVGHEIGQMILTALRSNVARRVPVASTDWSCCDLSCLLALKADCSFVRSTPWASSASSCDTGVSR